MVKDGMIRARTRPELKAEVETILKELGLTVTKAINLFFTQVKIHNGIPFDIKLPNKLTIKTFEDTDIRKFNILMFSSKKQLLSIH